MCDIARRNLRSFGNVRLTKIDGTYKPFEDCSIDLSFTVTVPHHVTDSAMLEALVKEICREARAPGHRRLLASPSSGTDMRQGAKLQEPSRGQACYTAA